MTAGAVLPVFGVVYYLFRQAGSALGCCVWQEVYIGCSTIQFCVRLANLKSILLTADRELLAKNASKFKMKFTSKREKGIQVRSSVRK